MTAESETLSSGLIEERRGDDTFIVSNGWLSPTILNDAEILKKLYVYEGKGLMLHLFPSKTPGSLINNTSLATMSNNSFICHWKYPVIL